MRKVVPASDHDAVGLQIGGLSLAYVTYRVGLAVYFSSVVMWCVLLYGLDYMCLLYLTNWTFLVQTVHIVIQATVVVREYALNVTHRGKTVVTSGALVLVVWLYHYTSEIYLQSIFLPHYNRSYILSTSGYKFTIVNKAQA